MDNEHQPVGEDEFVLRRIHLNSYKPQVIPPILRIAFQPNDRDTSGISVFRELFANPSDTLLRIESNKRSSYLVARLAVRDLLRLGLTDVPEPDPNGPLGHAVIPELSWQAFQSDKVRLKRVQVELATLASHAIVHKP